MELDNNKLGKLDRLYMVTPLSKYLAMTLFIFAPFVGAWIGYLFAPTKILEVEKIVTIEKETDERVTESLITATAVKIMNDDVEVSFSNATQKIVATSTDWEDTDDIFLIEKYLNAAISPSKKFIALNGIESEDYFVRVYDVEKDQLEAKTYGQFTGWTEDGKLEISSCNLAGEECKNYISVSAENPSILEEVTEI